MKNKTTFSKSLGTRDVMVAGVALVVAASTLVSDFNGYFSLGISFVIAVLIGFLINLLLGLSAAELSTAYPKAGALYNYAREIFQGNTGKFLGVFLGLSFYGMIALTMAGEAAAGAFGLQAMIGLEIPLQFYILCLSILAIIPNILGIRTTAWVSLGLLLLMLGIRWFFGLAGFLSWGNTELWSWANLQTHGEGNFWTGSQGILTTGLALAFWSFVGIEFACSLAEEVKNPSRSMSRGLVMGLVLVLLTSLVMGIGVSGALPLAEWQAALKSEIGHQGESPQLVVGYQMFGLVGYYLMALASVAATLGTLTVTYAAMPRLLFSIAQDQLLFGKLSKPVAKLHPKYQSPVVAIVVTFVLYMIPALYNSQVIDWIFSAAYVWILLYIVFHTLVIFQRKLYPMAPKAFAGNWVTAMAVAGILITTIGLYYAFAGTHAYYGSRALILLGTTLLVSGLSYHLQKEKRPVPKVRKI